MSREEVAIFATQTQESSCSTAFPGTQNEYEGISIATHNVNSTKQKKISSSREHDELILIDHVLGQVVRIR